MVEIMVGLVLGLMLTAAVISIFLSSKQTYRLLEAQSWLQEDGRSIMDNLETRLRTAGYSGCYGDLSSSVEDILNDSANFAWNLANPVQGFNNVGASDTIGGITDFIAGTDVLIVKGMSDGVPLATNPNTATFTIDAANNRFAAGDILLVTGCDRASLFQATGVSSASGVTTIQHASGGGMIPGNSSGTVNNGFGSDDEIGRLQTWMYYLQNGANGRPALYERSLAVTAGSTVALQSYELVQNVENMQIVFGVDNDGNRDADIYQDASAVTNWRNVVSVRIALLLASEEDNLVDDKQSYSFNAGTFTYDRDDIPAASADRRIRRAFIGYGALRNRTL